jgi:hypothetical protein
MEAPLPHAIVGRCHSLAAHLAALKVLVAVPLLALTIIPISIYIDSERERLQSTARVAREDILSLVDRDLSTKIATLRVLTMGRSLDLNDLDRFDDIARQLVGNEPFNIVLRDSDGRQLVNTALPKGAPLPSTPNAAIEGNGLAEPRVSGLIWSESIKQRAAMVIVPVIREGRLRYTILAVLPSEYFARLLREHAPPAPYYAIIADQDGTIIASSSRNEEFFGKVLQARHITTVEGRWSGLNPVGVPVAGVHSRSPVSGWIVAVSVSQAALGAPLRQSILLVLGAIVVIAAGAVGSGYLLSRQEHHRRGARHGARGGGQGRARLPGAGLSGADGRGPSHDRGGGAAARNPVHLRHVRQPAAGVRRRQATDPGAAQSRQQRRQVQ